MKNLFLVPTETPGDDKEFFESLLTGDNGLVVEKIISHGHTTPENSWYDQKLDEWITLLEGKAVIQYMDGSKISLSKGDTLFLPKHIKHRVAYTSSPCIWLAIHANKLLTS
jgi:cupin 2 domain-containing protein